MKVIAEPLAAVSVRVDFDAATEPGAVVVLLDLLASAGIRASWHLPADVDPALPDRLFFSGHGSVVADTGARDAAGAARLASEPIAWLHDVQIAVGRALEQRGQYELRIDTSALHRSASGAAVAEALDLIAGLVRAGRVRLAGPTGGGTFTGAARP